MEIRSRMESIPNEHRPSNKPNQHAVKADRAVELEAEVEVLLDTDREHVRDREIVPDPSRVREQKVEAQVELVDAIMPQDRQVARNLVHVPRHHPNDDIVIIDITDTIVITNDTNTIEIGPKNAIARLIANSYCIYSTNLVSIGK
jgi:hypothetical protein